MNGSSLRTNEPAPPESLLEPEKTEATGAAATWEPSLASATLNVAAELVNSSVGEASRWTAAGAAAGANDRPVWAAIWGEKVNNERSAADDVGPTAGPR